MITITKQEKIQLIESRQRNLEYKKYGLNLDLIVENAKATPDQKAIEIVTDAVSEIDVQLSALNAELTAVNALPDQE